MHVVLSVRCETIVLRRSHVTVLRLNDMYLVSCYVVMALKWTDESLGENYIVHTQVGFNCFLYLVNIMTFMVIQVQKFRVA